MAFFEQLDTMEPGEQSRSLRMIKSFIDLQEEAGGKIDFRGCVRIAFNRMMKDFRTSILDLSHSADEMEKVGLALVVYICSSLALCAPYYIHIILRYYLVKPTQSSGKKFWTGTKRKPRPVDWNNRVSSPLLMEYLYSTANLYALVWQVEGVRDRGRFETIVDDLKLEQPRWEASGEKVDLSEGDNEEGNDGGSGEDDEKLKGDLYKVDTSKLNPAQPQEFEKDGA